MRKKQKLGMGEKFGQLLRHLPYLPQAFSLVWGGAPRLTVVWIALLVVQGFLPVVLVYLTRALVDSLVTAIKTGGGWEAVRPTIIYIAFMAGLMITLEVLRKVTNYIRLAQAELVKDHISGLIHRQSTRVDLAFYDSPDFYDRLHRARTEGGHRPVVLIENVGALLQNGITLIAMAAVLVPYGLWLPAALVLSTLPALWVVLRNRVLHHAWRRKSTAAERRSWYYDWVLTSRDTSGEVAMFKLAGHFRNAFQSVRRLLRGERLKLAGKEAVSELAAGIFGLVVTGVAMAFMVLRAFRGAITLGDLALFYQAFNQGQRLMRTFLEQVGEIYSNMLFLGDLFEFLDMEPHIVSPEEAAAPPMELTDGLHFRNVTFSYTKGGKCILEDFDLHLPANTTTAIVGANGSGKSTILKLLCRLYDPGQGSVEIDGTDLREFSLDELRRFVTVIFQDPVNYNATVAENIMLGDIEGRPGMKLIKAAAMASGADETAERLKWGYDTLLGTWFVGGAELSGGEWKRIALARTLLRHAPVILLDEPTSEMDPWAAAEWARRFRALAAGRTAVIVTHRITTAAAADLIYVLDKGRVTESGSHTELINAGGAYADLWQNK